MPYEVIEAAGRYDVVNSDTGDVKATHDDKADADRQVNLLNKVEREADSDT
jgi:hypothetical protein